MAAVAAVRTFSSEMTPPNSLGVLQSVPENDDIFNSVVVMNGGDIGKKSAINTHPLFLSIYPTN